jgi:hypothetical protein
MVVRLVRPRDSSRRELFDARLIENEKWCMRGMSTSCSKTSPIVEHGPFSVETDFLTNAFARLAVQRLFLRLSLKVRNETNSLRRRGCAGCGR